MKRFRALNMTPQQRIGTEHVHACEAIEAYQAGLITLHELCTSMADIALHLPPQYAGMLDPNTGLRFK